MHDDANRTTTEGGDAREELTAIIRRPILFAATSGIVALGSISLLFSLDKFVAGPLIMGVPAVLICLLCVAQVINFSPAAVARLESFAEQVGGRFSLVKDGVGGHTAVPFAHGMGRRRVGVLNYTKQGLPIEIGQLLVVVDTRQPIEKRNAYAVIQLPGRTPHMILDFGHLSRFLGVRLAPVMWHRSQRVDDVEIKDRSLYLFSTRSIASGSDRRWRRQHALVEGLAVSVASSEIWDLARRQNRGRGPARDVLRADEKRVAVIIVSAGVAAFVVLTTLALYAREQGVLNL